MRSWVPWLLAIAGMALACWRGALAIHWLRKWLEWKTADPSGAELYEINLWIESTLAVLALCLAGLGVAPIRRRGRSIP